MPSWPFLLALVFPAAAIVLWRVWQLDIRPRLLPAAEIEALAAELVAVHGERAEEVAFLEEDRAWRLSDAAEQGKWRRVRVMLRRTSYREHRKRLPT